MPKTFCSYFIPCSNQHHAYQQFGSLKNRHKCAAVFAGIFAGLISLPLGGICGLAAFRKVVEMNKNAKAAKVSKSYTKVHGKKAKPKKTHKSTHAAKPKAGAQGNKKVSLLRYFEKHWDSQASKGQKRTVMIGFGEVLSSCDDKESIPEIFKQFKKKLQGYVDNYESKTTPYISPQTQKEAIDTFEKLFISASAKPTKSEPFFKPLKTLIPTIANPHKKAIYQNGMQHFEKLGLDSSLETHRLAHQEDYIYTKTEEPAYFEDKVDLSNPTTVYTENFYSYAPYSEATEDFWVIFSNARLGGGCFDKGGAMEEIAVMEMPQFAGFVASNQKKGSQQGGKHLCTVSIRDGESSSRYKVAEGQPNPMLVKGVYHVQKVQKGPKHTFKGTPLEPSAKLNLLAIAAPKLDDVHLAVQCDYKTAKDLFNSIMAGFILAEENCESSKIPMIHSGKLGAGAYNNNPTLVYVLHLLAARHLDVHLAMHGYSKKEADYAYSIFDSVDLTGRTLSESVELLADAVYLKEGGEV